MHILLQHMEQIQISRVLFWTHTENKRKNANLESCCRVMGERKAERKSEEEKAKYKETLK